MHGAVLLDPPTGEEKLVQTFKNLPVPAHIQRNLDRAQELAGPFEPRGSLNRWDEVLRSEIADATAVANTTTETILVPNFTLPARYLMPTERTLRATVAGRYSDTGTPTMTIALRIGGVAGVLVVTSAAYTLPSGVTNVPFWIDLLATVRTAGATGTVFGMGKMIFASAAPNTLATQLIPASAPAVSPSIDMTAAQDLSITAKWSAASASNTITAHMYTLESMN